MSNIRVKSEEKWYNQIKFVFTKGGILWRGVGGLIQKIMPFYLKIGWVFQIGWVWQLKEDNDRQHKLKENYTLQQATNLESGSIRKVKQTVIITKNETNSIWMSKC